MPGFNQITIGGYQSGGLTTDKKPFLLVNDAFTELTNAYVWRYRVKKREGTKTVGRLQRNFSDLNFLKSGVSPYFFNALTITGKIIAANNANPGKITTQVPHKLLTGNFVVITGIIGATGYNNKTFTITKIDEYNFTVGVNAGAFGLYVSGGTFVSNRQLSNEEQYCTIKPGTFSYTIKDVPEIVFSDNGDGTLTGSVDPANNTGLINYNTGFINITTTAAATLDTTLTYSYYPGLPVMGISKQDTIQIGIDNTIYFDTKYAYEFNSGAFQEVISTTPVIWSGTDTDFFLGSNYHGVDPSIRFFFVTNNNINDPIRYYNNTTWFDLVPVIADNPPSAASYSLFQMRILLPYYGRMIAMNTWEGLTANGAGASSNYFTRCRFSQIGDPTAADAWRSDIYGKGGFIDAPTNEIIIGAQYFRNTLIVFFEYSVWQLRYIGEYGVPFIFERISSDFGSSSTFSTVVFDSGVLAVGGRGIIETASHGVKRIDEKIPDYAFNFEVANSSTNFIHGVRDFQKELVYWNYIDKNTLLDTQLYPTNVLVFNYINYTFAKFYDTITCFGNSQFQLGVTWDSDNIFWTNEHVTWDDSDDQNETVFVTAGNQQGFVRVYENQSLSTETSSKTLFSPSLFIYSVNTSVSPTRFLIPKHNLTNNSFILINSSIWTGTDPDLNGKIFKVHVYDTNNINLYEYDEGDYDSVRLSSASSFKGGGLIEVLQPIIITTKDFNPYQDIGKQFKLSQIDFQVDQDDEYPGISVLRINLYVNSYLGATGNIGGKIPYLYNATTPAGTIYDLSNTNPMVITSEDHSLETGKQVYFSGIVGPTSLNNTIHPITVIDADTYSIEIDGTVLPTYESGGLWNVVPYDGTTYISGSQYNWYRFYANLYGQYLRIQITYGDQLMNLVSTHQSSFELNGMNIYFRPGGRITN